MGLKGECRRCGKVTSLCRSHIIPEGAFRPVYDENSRALTLDSDGSPARPVQQGIWEYLFCRDCEDFFETLETPFLRFWRHPKTLPGRLSSVAIRVVGVDYENVKRFLLSVLWRAHVSSRGEFSGVNLGPHGEKIDQLLRVDPPIAPELYPMFGYALKNVETAGPDFKVVLTPARFRVDGHSSYLLAFLGVGWLVVVSSHSVSLPRSCLLEPRKELLLPVVRTSEFGPMMQLLRSRSGRGALGGAS